LGKAYQAVGDQDNAHTYFEKVVRLFPDSPQYCPAYAMVCTQAQGKEHQSCITDFIRFCGNKPEVVLNAYQEQMEKACSSRAYQECSDLVDQVFVYQQTLTADPSPQSPLLPLAKLYAYKAQAALGLGNYAEAVNNYRLALNVSTESAEQDTLYAQIGGIYLKKKAWEEAAAYFSKMREGPEKALALANYTFMKQEYPKALTVYQQMSAGSCGNPLVCCQAALGVADSLYAMKRFADAEGAYTQVLSQCKQYPREEFYEQALYGLGWTYLKQDRYKEAVAFFGANSEGYSRTPAAQMSLQLSLAHGYKESGDMQKALAAFQDVLAKNPQSAYADYILFQIGMCHLQAGRIKNAVIAFAEMKKRFPESSYAHLYVYYIGTHYFNQQEYAAAQEYLERFVDENTDPEYQQRANLLLLEALFRKEDYAGLLMRAERIINENVFGADEEGLNRVRYFVSMAFKETGRIEEAFALWKELVRSPLTIQLRSSLYVYIGDYYYTYKKDLAQAVFYYTKLLNEYPYTTFKAQAQLRVGQCLVQQGKASDAVFYLSAVAQDGPARKEKKEALLLLAGIYESQREYALADAAYNRYGLLFPDETRFIAYKKGVLSFLQDDYHGAIEYLQQALQQGYESSEAQFYLAAAKEKLGQTEEAIALYQRVVSSSQNGEFAIQSYIHLARLYEKKGNQPAAIEAYRILSESNSEEAAYAREKLAQLQH